MTEWIVSSSVLILVVALVRQVLKGRLSLRLQYALWALVLVRLLVPVSFGQSKLSVLNAVEERQAAQITVDIPPSRGDYVPPDLAPVEPDPALPTEEQEEQYRQNQQQWQNQMDAAWEQYKVENTKEVTISVPEILHIVWYAGMAVMALCLLWSNLAFWLRLRRSRRPLEVADCPLPVYVTGAAETPCLFGLLRPAVYVTPEAAADGAALGHVLAHEYTHCRHGDHIWAVLRCLCLAVHWYNPLVWLAAALSRRDAELACDEGTLRRIGEGERLAYGRTLIGLTCTRRGGLLRTATTMTGSKRSIRERITLIAKKPRMAACTLVAVLLIAAVAAGCTFTGAKQDAPAEWTAMLTEESVFGVTVYDGSGQALARLDQESRTELLTVIHGITEDMCRPLEEGDTAEEGQPSVIVYQGLNLWRFRCREDGQVRLAPFRISSRSSTDPSYEVGVEKMVIDCPELCQFILDRAAAYGGSDTPADPGDEGYAVDLDDAPQTVRQTIEGYVADRAAAMDRVVSEAEITGLTRMSTGTASEYNSIELYRLDYRLTFADSGENDAPVDYICYLAFLRELTVSVAQNPVFIGSVDGDELKAGFGSAEMLERYGNIYTAAAMGLYQAYLEGQEPGTAAYFQELLKYDGGETWYNGALTCVYAAPEDIALEYVFYNKFPGGEEWQDFTAEEQAYLISQNQDKNFGFGHLSAQKRPAEQLEAMLQRYFGVSLSDVKIPDSWVYYEATDSYYSCHGDFYIMDWLTVTRVVDQGNGVYHIWYTSARSSAQNPATGQTYTDMVLTVRRNAAGEYMVLSNLPASGRGIVLEDADMWPQEAVWEFARVYGAELMSIPGYITDYEIIWCEPRAISADGDAVIGFFRCFARSSGSGELMALNGWEETNDGRWVFDTLFLLERAGGTGRWYCSQWKDIGQLADYGYEDGMIGAIMGNTEVYRCEGDDPYEAALTLMTAYVEDLLVPAEMRSFTITEYRNLSVTLKPTLELDEAEIFNYQPVDGEMGENTWIVELSMEYRWDGVLMGPPYGPSIGHEDYWADMVHQGSPVGFLLTRNGNEFTLQSRYAVRY